MTVENQLSLEEVIEFAKRITDWVPYHKNQYKGSVIKKLDQDSLFTVVHIHVAKTPRIFRKPLYDVFVLCNGSFFLADYKNPRAKEIYEIAENQFQERAAAIEEKPRGFNHALILESDRKAGLSLVRGLIQT